MVSQEITEVDLLKALIVSSLFLILLTSIKRTTNASTLTKYSKKLKDVYSTFQTDTTDYSIKILFLKNDIKQYHTLIIDLSQDIKNSALWNKIFEFSKQLNEDSKNLIKKQKQVEKYVNKVDIVFDNYFKEYNKYLDSEKEYNIAFYIFLIIWLLTTLFADISLAALAIFIFIFVIIVVVNLINRMNVKETETYNNIIHQNIGDIVKRNERNTEDVIFLRDEHSKAIADYDKYVNKYKHDNS
jgi:hypothetical protein